MAYPRYDNTTHFRAELKHPLKRRIGMRYSNEFYS
jgi:hypothetical protein